MFWAEAQGWLAELGNGPDLAEKAVEHARAFHDMPAHHLQYFIAVHQHVVGQVNHTHATPAELAFDLVIAVTG
jgi:hypothetical protein